MSRKSAILASGALVASLLSGAIAVPAVAEDAADPIAKGRELAFERKKGNCLACHAIGDGELAGTIAPPLLMMKQRFPDKADLREQVANPQVRNARTTMPPFGKHRILSDEEIDLIVDYIYTL